MKKPTLMVGAGALALLVVAVGLSLRPGSDPVAANGTMAIGCAPSVPWVMRMVRTAAASRAPVVSRATAHKTCSRGLRTLISPARS